MTPACLIALVLTASPNPHLATAEDLVSQVRYADAEKSLALARAQANNPRPALLRILELQGIVAATLGQGPKARGSFQQLLSLDPERKLPEGLPPRVRTPFYEAKGMASEAAPMIFSANAEASPEGPVLRARLSADPLGLARKVRFHLRLDGGSWKNVDQPLTNGAASAAAGPGRLEGWAELLGEQDATLFASGSEEKPFVEGNAQGKPSLAPVATADAPADAPLGVETRPSSSRVNPAVWVCFGGAGATAIGGIVAGVLSRGTHARVDGAAKNSSGFVEGMTQREAAGLREQAKTQAIAANVLFGAAGALAATGAVIWLFSGTSKVALVPSPGGVVAVGELP